MGLRLRQGVEPLGRHVVEPGDADHGRVLGRDGGGDQAREDRAADRRGGEGHDADMLATAITPTFNRSRYLPSVAACFLAQTADDSEMIVLDDGDQSARPFVPDHPRIRYVHLSGKRLSTGAKRNICCEMARGEFILHFDNDDWSAPTRIASQVASLRASGK